MKNKKWSLLALMLAIGLLLAACSSDKSSNEKEKDNEKEKGAEQVDREGFPTVVVNEDAAIEGGTLNVALVNSSPFQGIFSLSWYEDAYDADIMEFMSNNIFKTDGDFLVTEGGIATLDVDTENNKATVKIREGVKWSDGEPLKIEDLILPYEIIGHPDYDGKRYGAEQENVIGMTEYHEGKAETISGLKKVDETTLEISFKQLSPAVFTGVGDGLLYYAEPSHYLADVEVKDMLASEKIRNKPVTLGAFKVDSVVNGESVKLVANEHYWQGKPKIETVIIKNVPPTTIVAALKAGEYDIALSMPTDSYMEYKELDNIQILGRAELSYSYLGFNLGKFDADKGEAVMDENAKMSDLELRKAMSYAMNIEEVNEYYYNGLRTRGNSLIPPAFSTYYDGELEGYTYDADKANEILDKAGYEDKDGDGFREDKDGNPLEIKFAFMAGGDSAEPMAQFYIQNWADVGLKVELTDGRLLEFQNFYDRVEANDENIDIYMAAWGTGTNPSPIGLYGPKEAFNMSRYNTEEHTKLLTAIDSPEAMDPKFRADAFKAWQEHMAENIPVVPTQFRTELVPVNNRVKGVDISYGTHGYIYHEWELTAETAPKSTK
ncbi:oligopeptide ABC transporter substrate-binding protein [Bacillus sp. AGMB 02131]|uniref:Oligopeptide ABC transporter substrate-binding protein n=1 Tax=Peribacillus faecalis TaxID=2772559 RepID=A0A927D0D0_9BACI|nr:oligopeptide ABC transporter substrate-binding protein [Peribacillus faecalis]MBD3110336.1 oligopeptide ABC transporter substrate-binding protein [Peribacillus faecalis]